MLEYRKENMMKNKFDIYEFINSKAIRNHCREIKHKFSSVEAAYLIWASENHTIEDKHNTFIKLSEEFPDMEIAERPWPPRIESLHAFLKRFIQIENKYISTFYKDEPNCVYSYEIWYPGAETVRGLHPRLFSKFSICYEEIKRAINEHLEHYKNIGYNIKSICIKATKSWIINDKDDYSKRISLLMNYDNEPIDIYDYHTIISDEDREVLDAFKGMRPEIPTPFKKGDILTLKNRHNRNYVPFVLDKIPYWENAVSERVFNHLRNYGDESDLMADVYGITDDGAICRDHGPSYLDMEYYEGELEHFNKFLAVLSGFFKNEYDAAVLIEAYDYLKNEKQRKISYEYLSAYKNPHLIAAGFKEN